MVNWTQWNRILYSGWAPFYDLLVTGLEDKRRTSLQLADVKPGERVLLLGAGTGLDLKYLPKNAEITAIDITPGMITRLEKRAEKLNLTVDARVMDGQNLEFNSDSFDVVILHFVLAVIPNPTRTIREAQRVLRTGGRAIILNKFAKDEADPSLLLRCANRIARPLITDITVQLAPLVEASGMERVYEKKIGFAGLFKMAILQKSEHSVSTYTEPEQVEAAFATKPKFQTLQPATESA